MNLRETVALAAAGAMMGLTLSLFAADDAPAPKSEPIYGYRMMNPQERDDFRARMRGAKSPEERQAIRDEHRRQMEERARERGVTLPGPHGPGGGYGPRGDGKGGYGPGPRGNCPAGQECPGRGGQ